MAKKQTWKEQTGLRTGDIAHCNGTVRYSKKSYIIDEDVQIEEIKSNACTCIVKKLGEKENVSVSILKRYLSNPNAENITDNKIEENDTNDTIDEIKEENPNVIIEDVKDNIEEKTCENSTIESEIIEKTNEEVVESDNTKEICNTTNLDTETINEDPELRNDLEKNENIESILETVPDHTQNNETTFDTVTKNLSEQTKEIIAEVNKEENGLISIPRVGFKNYFINNELKVTIEKIANYQNGTLISSSLKNKMPFHRGHIKELKEMFLHIPINKNPFKPNMCYKLICEIDYKKVSELTGFINQKSVGVDLVIFINQDNFHLQQYEFRVIDNRGYKHPVNIGLSRLQEADIETYGKRCAKYYEELVKSYN